MNKRKTARIFLLIPIIIAGVLILDLGISSILELQTGRGPIYKALALIGGFGSILVPVLCFLFSALGIVFAFQAKQKETVKPVPYIVVGIVEIMLSLLVGGAWIYIGVIGGAGV